MFDITDNDVFCCAATPFEYRVGASPRTGSRANRYVSPTSLQTGATPTTVEMHRFPPELLALGLLDRISRWRGTRPGDHGSFVTPPM